MWKVIFPLRTFGVHVTQPCARDTAIACRGEHPTHTHCARLACIAVPTEMVPRGMQWCIEACRSKRHCAPDARSSAGIVALAE